MNSEPFLIKSFSSCLLTQDQKLQTSSDWNTILKILKINSPEWLSMVTGALASLMNGASLPLYGLIFGDILGVSFVFFSNCFGLV